MPAILIYRPIELLYANWLRSMFSLETVSASLPGVYPIDAYAHRPTSMLDFAAFDTGVIGSKKWYEADKFT